MLLPWLLFLPAFFVLVCTWTMIAPIDAMSAIGNSRRNFRDWVWKRAKGRFVSRYKHTYRSKSALNKAAKRYADEHTLKTLGEPDDAELFW